MNTGVRHTIFFLFLSLLLNAQYEGKLLDGKSKEGLAFVNVVNMRNYQVSVTDMSGRFILNKARLSDTLMISYAGYKQLYITVHYLTKHTAIYLRRDEVDVDKVDIVVQKKQKRNRKTDPAYLLHKSMVKNKRKNDFKGRQSYQCDIYNRVEVDVNNVTDKTRDILIFKPVAFLFDDIDSTSLPKKFVPVLYSEGASEYYHHKDGARKEMIKGSKISGIAIPSLSRFTGNMYLDFNVYNDYINLFQKSFVSPMADQAWITYNFYLTDSVQHGDTTDYKLEFIPRRKNELGFKGALWTDNKTFAIHRIKLNLLKSANVNYIQQFDIEQSYQLDDSLWVLNKEKLFMDVYLSKKIYGFYIKKETDYYKYEHPKEFEDGFFNLAEKSVDWDSLATYGDQYIRENAPEITDTAGNVIYHKIDSAMNTPYVKFWKNLARMFYVGYYPLKYVELGTYYTMYSYNPIEGNRFRLGGGTLDNLFPNTQLYGHAAYGTKDQLWKGRFRVTHFFNKKKWRYLRAYYFNDYSILSASSNAFQQDNIMSSLSRRVNPRFTHLKFLSGEYYHTWYNGIENYVQFNWEEYRPIGSLIYEQPDGTELNLIRMNTVKFGGRLAFDESFIYYGFRRFSMSTRKPIVDYKITKGLVIDNEGYDFTKVELTFSDRYYLGMLGYLNVYSTAGKVWGNLPYPMLLNHPGNDSYYFDNKAFNLMNPYEFVSDEQVTLMLTHNFNGLILNQFPLFKKLHWRSLIFARGAIGRLSGNHEDIVVLPEGLSALSEPYAEAGFGVENIFKLLRVDLLWRLTNVGNQTQVFGFNFAIQPRL